MAIISQQDEKELKEAFSLLDINGDGLVSEKEMEGLLKAMGAKDNLKSLITEAKKTNLTGKEGIDLQGFMNVVNKLIRDDSKVEDVIEAMRVFDSKNSFRIDAKEFKDQLQQAAGLSDEDWEELMKEANVDSDGTFDYREFASKLCSRQ
ncbi:hypothetical protein FDP41_005904 [Naegleria fowleri]|uniref:EF-hand domain-containing protein n=1 Tax=Naegleria fowleri TaxID=5763 RepID=A0A6A5BLD0_NAEFO|nr:uncharacterized protein FDP41_005904 [Naegleria fowleri]KAF0975151.1 hypothetical protein FDP41_005904 [Naegleria fowleri]CAG4708150.1 unnamed protein product [Naegleria fowleri]